MLIFQMPQIEEKQFTNCKTIKYLEEKDSNLDLHPTWSGAELENQLSASFIVWAPGAKQRKVISNWFEIALVNNYQHLTGLDPQDEKCCDQLIEHRHDQSILSLLVKMHYLERFPDESHSNTEVPSTKLPIWAIKNFTAESQLSLRRKRMNKFSRYVSVSK